MSNPINFDKKTFALITGASKGIGREIAIQLSNILPPDSTILLIARSRPGLEATKNLMNSRVHAQIFTVDLSKPDEKIFKTMLEEQKKPISEAENAVIVHNAGSLGKVDKLKQIDDSKLWQEFCNLNISSVTVLNAIFLQSVQGKNVLVINMTSLFGRQAFQSVGMYGMGKAARDFYFKVLAVEEADVRVLNYSPGPVDTDMLDEVKRDIQDPGIKERFADPDSARDTLTPKQTVTKLMETVKMGRFKSGDTVDYFDE